MQDNYNKGLSQRRHKIQLGKTAVESICFGQTGVSNKIFMSLPNQVNVVMKGIISA